MDLGRIGAQNRSTGRKTLETGNVVVRRATQLTGLAPTHYNINGQAKGRVSSSYFREAAAHRIHWQARCKCPRIGFAGLGVGEQEVSWMAVTFSEENTSDSSTQAATLEKVL